MPILWVWSIISKLYYLGLKTQDRRKINWDDEKLAKF